MPESASGSVPGPRRALALALLLALVTFGVFARTASNGFVDYDDPAYVTRNPQVLRGLTPAGAAWAFTTFSSANWHPLTWLSHMLDVSLFGLDAGRHHLMSAGFHACTAGLLLLLLHALTGRLWPSAAVAALFALHPLRVESVAWASERKDVLAGLFWVLACGAHLRYARRPSAVRLCGVAALLALGLMAKPMLVTLPLALLLIDWWPLGRGRALAARAPALSPLAARLPLVLEKAPLLLLSAAASWATLLAQREGGALNLPGVQHLGLRLANVAVAYAEYLAKLAWPLRLAVHYPLQVRPAWQTAAAVALLAGLSLAAIRWARRRPWLAFGWLWYLGTLVPVVGFVQAGGQGLADRYSYLPSVGVFLAAAWALAGVARRGGGTLAASAALTVLAPLAALSWRQTAVWRDSATLFAHALAVTERNWLAHNNLAFELRRQGRNAEALEHFREAARINPAAADHASLGALAAAAGRLQEAVEAYTRALEARPSSVVDRYNVAGVLVALGRDAEAMAHYREALRLDPRHAESHNNLAILLSRRGDAPGAAEHFAAALRARPGYAEAHFNLGLELSRLGREREAVGHYRQAVGLRPDYVKAQAALAAALRRLGEEAAAR